MKLKYREEYDDLNKILCDYCKKENKNSFDSKKDVIEYLSKLDMDLIKEIQVILHIGCTCKENVMKPELLFDNIKQNFDVLKGWRTKEIEISNMVIDAPLDKYFEDGIEILQLKN